MIQAIVFLGNPGRQYAKTRHNAAWQLLPYFHESNEATWQRKLKGEYAVVRTAALSRHLLKPLTFMNKSGESVRVLCDFIKITSQELLVVHDEVELAFGEAGYKRGGGAAGHNGLRSIVSHLGGNDFHRFRIGVGRPDRGLVSSFLLSAFDRDEQEALPEFLVGAAGVLDEILALIDGGAEVPSKCRRILVV